MPPSDSGRRRDDRTLTRVRAALDGRYLIERRLGHGAMAVVFRAQRIDENRAVAVKVMRPEIGYEDGVVERFRIEREVMAQLDHPHIVRINASGEAGRILWFEMDLIEGSSLAPVLQHGAPRGSSPRRLTRWRTPTAAE